MSENWPDYQNHRLWWRINVGGYGDFAFWGSQAEAEERRRAKAEWEGACATKEPIPESHPLVSSEIEHPCCDLPDDPTPLATMKRRYEAVAEGILDYGYVACAELGQRRIIFRDEGLDDLGCQEELQLRASLDTLAALKD